jgi:hypothetical protein
MKRRLLASVALTCLALQIFSTTEATEPAKQIFITDLKPVIINKQILKITPTAPPSVAPIFTPTPTVRPTIKPTPKPTPRPTIKAPKIISNHTFPVDVLEAREYALSKIGKVQFNCLDILFARESRWRDNAMNKHSGAYGIPQALPGSKMAKAGADWLTNPTTQVKWGLMYISGRYGSACNALQHSYNTGWY